MQHALRILEQELVRLTNLRESLRKSVKNSKRRKQDHMLESFSSRYAKDCTPKIKSIRKAILALKPECECFWCDNKINAGEDRETLPGKRGQAHKKCAEEWYGVQMAEKKAE